jgi:phosphoglycolate phosphatase
VEASRAVMIGDLGRDISGARRNSVSGIGVLWGYGTREELEAAGAVVCVASAAELAAVVREHFPESEAIATWLPVA